VWTVVPSIPLYGEEMVLGITCAMLVAFTTRWTAWTGPLSSSLVDWYFYTYVFTIIVLIRRSTEQHLPLACHILGNNCMIHLTIISLSYGLAIVRIILSTEVFWRNQDLSMLFGRLQNVSVKHPRCARQSCYVKVGSFTLIFYQDKANLPVYLRCSGGRARPRGCSWFLQELLPFV
jgi:hypothetical protein